MQKHERLVITLDEETTKKYLELAGKVAQGEVNEDCMPTGSAITIDIAPGPFDSEVSFGDCEIGIASVDLLDNEMYKDDK